MKTNPLWDFSLAVYARPGATEELLWWQDALSADINMLLAAAWLGSCGEYIDDDAWQQWVDCVAPWREAVLLPLREGRRQLGLDGASASLYMAAKRLELQAERVQQDMMLADQPVTSTTSLRPGEITDQNCCSYLAASKITATDLEQRIASLLSILASD